MEGVDRDKMKDYSRKEFERVLANNGYVIIRQDGKHCVWQKDGTSNIAIPKHKLQTAYQRKSFNNGGLKLCQQKLRVYFM